MKLQPNLRAVLVTVLLAGAIAACRPPAPAPPAGPLNVVLISIDTLRADHLSSYGYSHPTSPAIDRLAAEGVSFDNAFAQRGLTWPSLTSIITGRYPGSHGVRTNPGWLDASIRTLPESLKDAGYTTAAFLTNMTNAPHRGIDTVEGFLATLPGLSLERTVDMLAVRSALGWLAAHDDEKPFFLWLHLLAPHASYAPPVGYDALFTAPGEPPIDGFIPTLNEVTRQQRQLSEAELAHVIGLYDGEVALADSLVDLLLRKLDERGLTERTLVVLTADHGEELYDRKKYFYHKCSIYDSVLRIPLVLRLPGALPAGRRIGAVVESIDLVPTIGELIGVEPPAGIQGHSLLPLLAPGGAPEWKNAAFSELEETIASVRTERWRYVANPLGAEIVFRGEAEPCYPLAREELYDHQNDPGELVNVAEQNPAVAAELRQRVREWRQSSELVKSLTREVDAATLEQLRALGYIH